MIRQLIILVLVLTVSKSICGQKRIVSKDRILSSTSLKVDTSVIAILPFEKTQNWLFKDSNPIELSNADLALIEKLLRECIDNYNPVQERQYNEIKTKNPNAKIDKKYFVIDLTRYKRQYIAVTNSRGEKVVWVNCFCNTLSHDWKNEIFGVKDGGNCFFELKINLTSRKYYELSVNGDA